MALHWFLPHDEPKGWLRATLARLGPSWHASPWRRVIQSASLILFATVLLIYARPGAAGESGRADPNRTLVDLFLAMDPLVSATGALASRGWAWSLPLAGAVLLAGLVIPRLFCGYLCPMGTLIDLADWAVLRHVRRFRVGRPGRWQHIRYVVLAAVLVSAGAGVVITGFVSPIPLLTRGLHFAGDPMGGAQLAGLTLLVAVLLLGLLRPRFWCRHVCPSGALFSVCSRARVSQRHVSDACTQCGRCASTCSFDAINDDFSTTDADCAFCQTCAGVCPKGAIRFGTRWAEPAPLAPPPPSPTDLSRRGFLLWMAGGAAAGGAAATGIRLATASTPDDLIRPPGSVLEPEFLRRCVRCGQCLRVCPNGFLQPAELGYGIERLWTPRGDADRVGCEPGCTRCSHACPTGAIARIALAQKRHRPIGLSVVDESTCLQSAAGAGCVTRDTEGNVSLICRDACDRTGYFAIEILDADKPTPLVADDRCTGCGACQAACFSAHVRGDGKLQAAAIRVRVGDGRASLAT